jgi:hypothetical protein
MFGEITTGLNGKQVFVLPQTGDYTTEVDITAFMASAPTGALGIFDKNANTLITAALVAGQEYYIAQKVIVNGKKTVNKSAIIKHTRNAGGSPVNAYGRVCPLVVGALQSTSITIPSAATVKGQTFGIRIFDRGWASEKYPEEFYYFVSKTGAESAATIATNIIANYTAAQTLATNRGMGFFPSRYTIASGGAGVITITALDARTHFEIGWTPDVELTTVPTVTPVTAWKAAEGTAVEVKRLEWEGKHRDGYTIPLEKHVRDNYGGDYTFVVDGCTYDMIYLNPVQDRGVLDVMDAKINYGVVLAVQSTAAGTTDNGVALTNMAALKTVLEL